MMLEVESLKTRVDDVANMAAEVVNSKIGPPGPRGLDGIDGEVGPRGYRGEVGRKWRGGMSAATSSMLSGGGNTLVNADVHMGV